VLSSFNPVAVLKGAVGRSSWRRGIGLRQGMVVFQFATCTCLMVGTTAVYLQTEFMRNQRPGIDLEQILVLKAPPLTGDSAARANRWQTFRQTVGAMGAIRNVTGANGLPSRGFSNYNYTSVVGKPKPGEGTFQTYPTMRVDIDFFRTFSLPLLAGRVFSPGLASDRQAVVLSGEAARRLGFAHPKEAIGRQIELDKKYTIIGVTQNYHHDLSKEGFHPTLFLLNQTPGVYFALKMAGGDLPAAHLRRTIREVEAHWKQIYPGNPFEYFFLDESFEAQYRSDEQLGRTVALFAFLTISVACLGLFGLASFTTTQRTKEIGIRKALGAPLGSLLLLLSRDFLRLVILANLMAAPLAHLAVSAWLENYAFDFPVSPWLYLLPMGIVLLIALLTVSYKTLRAAGQNPVKALRYE
jgi:putative ABC transport system permease protein